MSQGFPERFVRALQAHLDWLQEPEANGTLLLSGPVDQDLGLGRGLTVLRAASRDAAAAIVAGEPMGVSWLPEQHRPLMDGQRRLDHHPREFDGKRDGPLITPTRIAAGH